MYSLMTAGHLHRLHAYSDALNGRLDRTSNHCGLHCPISASPRARTATVFSGTIPFSLLIEQCSVDSVTTLFVVTVAVPDDNGTNAIQETESSKNSALNIPKMNDAGESDSDS